MDRALTRCVLAQVALSVHNATDVRTNIREVRDEAQRALPDLDPSLVEDLLITAVTTAEPDVDAVTRLWGAAALQDAAPRLIAVLDELSHGH